MRLYYQRPDLTIYCGDCRDVLRSMPAESVHCVVTSPPYWGLRDYGVDGQLGLEPTPEGYVQHMVDVFREVRRVLRSDSVAWINLGDSYAGSGKGHTKHGTMERDKQRTNAGGLTGATAYVGSGLKPKDLVGIPWRVALALQEDGWWLRSMMPWIKRAAMPESCQDRPTSAVEYVLLLSKSARYFYDTEAVRQVGTEPERIRHDRIGGANGHLVRHSEGGIMRGSATRQFRNSDFFFSSLGLLLNEDGEPLALDVNPKGFPGAHFATFPPDLVSPLIAAGTSERGVCSECGAPWTRVVEREEGEPESYRGNRFDRGKTAVHQLERAQQGSRGYRVAVGWQPTCNHDADLVPATVLDPFAGSGTVGLVAHRMGRHTVLIDLNPEYCEMMRERLAQVPLFGAVL